MNFIILDVVLLVAFLLFVSIFLYKHRKNLKKEGLLFLYKTSWGMKVITKFGEKHRKLLNFLSYVTRGLGFILMGMVIYLFGKILWMYIFSDIAKMVKVPPIMPLIPYLPQIFKMNLPPFYFIYWIIILAVVAISHEFSHGIFAVNKKVGIKSTGFGFFPFFFPVFPAAFVELDEPEMEKKKISHQMAILSAGTFANVIVGILALLLLIGFFSIAYTPSGVAFDTYTYSAVSISAISSINSISLKNASYEKIFSLSEADGFNEIEANGLNYLISKTSLETQVENEGYLTLYDDAPAIRANLSGVILKINGIKINSKDKLEEELLKYSPGDEITITGLYDDADMDYEIVLGENLEDIEKPYLGIGFFTQESSGIFSSIMKKLASFKDESIYYTSNFEMADFIYNLLWWLMLINFSVALVNMLPVGIFDGGRFFYLAMLAITKNEKKSKKIFGAMTYLFLALVGVMMVFWAIGMFG